MNLATFASTALTTLLLAGSAMAATPAPQDPNIPTREYQVAVVSTQSTSGESIQYASEDVLPERDRTIIGQDTVTAYSFGNDAPEASIQSPGADYR
ncbi:hypothetical protein [Pseudooceanicola sp. LIPI14-2-Ac024]|uniref:hypothetical protein n=1 Tax=Pseudooceanicola sp. LIPI14-2-Ac024 TaxID=3344875 RepID=UPI0035CF75CA